VEAGAQAVGEAEARVEMKVGGGGKKEGDEGGGGEQKEKMIRMKGIIPLSSFSFVRTFFHHVQKKIRINA
jgi:hypothetical protein